VAQSIWWIASVIGIDQELSTYIDKLYNRLEIPVKESAELSVPTQLSLESDNSAQPHPERKNQINNTRTESQDDSDSKKEQHYNEVLAKAERLLNNSKSQREKVIIDPLRRTRKGKQIPAKLTKSERRRWNQLTQESPDQIKTLLWN